MQDASRLFGQPVSGLRTAVQRNLGPAVADGPVRRQAATTVTVHPLRENRERATERRLEAAVLDLAAIRQPADVLSATLRAARDVTGAECAALALASTTIGDDARLACDDEGACDTVRAVLRDDPRLALADGEDEPLRIVMPGPRQAGRPPARALRSLLGVPIVLGGEMGTLYLVNRAGSRAFADHDVASTRRLAAHAEVAFENALVHQRALARAHELDQTNADLQRDIAAKSRFLANVSHELRTPLHAILLAAQLLRSPSGTVRGARQAPWLSATIEGSGRHLLSLIDDVVDLSRSETSDLGLHRVAMELQPLLADLRHQVEPLAKERQIRLAIAGGAGTRLTADPRRLRQVLLNLLANAIKFTEPGGRVRLHAAVEGGVLRVRVHDTGVGIASADIDRIFQPFERVAAGGTPGSGLGLTIARRIAELHGGTLTATSTPGIGSTFTLRIPSAPGTSTAGAPAADDQPVELRVPVGVAGSPMASATG